MRGLVWVFLVVGTLYFCGFFKILFVLIFIRILVRYLELGIVWIILIVLEMKKYE